MWTFPPVLSDRRAPQAPALLLPITRNLFFVERLTLLVTALLLASSIGGLAFPEHLYGDDAMLPALLGQDVIAIVFGVPLLLASAASARRGSTRGLLCWMGALFYVAYFWYFYVIGIRFNPLFPVHIAIVSMSLFGLLYLFVSLDLDWLRASFDERLPVRAIAVFLMATAAAFFGMWAVLIYSNLRAGTQMDLVSRYVVAIDAVVLLPLSFFGGYWLWGRDPLGYALAGVLLVKMVATFLTLVATSMVALQYGQALSAVQSSAYVIGLILASVSLMLCLRSVDAE